MDNPQQLLTPVGVPTFYFNGIGVGIGAIDMSVILHQNQIPITELKVPYPIAKTLSEALAKAVADYEKATGQKVLGAPELASKFEGSISPKKKN